MGSGGFFWDLQVYFIAFSIGHWVSQGSSLHRVGCLWNFENLLSSITRLATSNHPNHAT